MSSWLERGGGGGGVSRQDGKGRAVRHGSPVARDHTARGTKRYSGAEREKKRRKGGFGRDSLCVLLPPGAPRAGLRQTHLVDQHLGAAAQGGHERAQDAQRVPVHPVVQHPPEQVHVCAAHGLLREEVVRLEGQPAPELGRHSGRCHHLGEVLHHAAHVGEGPGQGQRHRAVRAAYVDHETLVLLLLLSLLARPRIPVDDVLVLEAGLHAEEGDGVCEAARAHGVVADGDEDGLRGMVGNGPPALGWLLGARPALHGVSDLRGRGPHLLAQVTDAGLQVSALAQRLGGRRVGDLSVGRFGEDAVCHGIS